MSATQDTPPELVDQEYTLADYWAAVYRRRWIILLVAAVAAVFAGVVSSVLPKQYEASVVFFVPRGVESSMGIGTNLMQARLPSGLQDHARAYASILQQNTDAWIAVHKRFPKKPLWRFRQDLDIVATREGAIVIYCRDGDPQTAADIANAMVDYFNEFNRQIVRRGLEQSLAKIDAEVKNADQQILDAIRARQAFQEEHGIASMPRNLEQLEAQRVEFNRRLLEARVELASVAEQIASLDRQMDVESERYVRGALLETQEGQFFAQLRQRKTLLEVERSGLEAEIAGVEKAIETIDNNIRSLPVVVSELMGLDDEVQGHIKIRERFEQTRDDLRTRSLELQPAALVIRAAQPPALPVFPRTNLNIAVAGFAGLLVGMAYALLIEGHRKRRLRDSVRNLEVERRNAPRSEEKRETAG